MIYFRASLFALLLNTVIGYEMAKKLPPILPQGARQKKIDLRNSESSKDPEVEETQTDRVTFKATNFWATSGCHGTYNMEENEGSFLTTPYTNEPVDCMLEFYPANTNLLLTVTVHDLHLKFNCAYESIKITVDDTVAQACTEGGIPTLTGRNVTIEYKRKLKHFHGGYAISVVANQAARENLVTLFKPYIDKAGCGLTVLSNVSDSEQVQEDTGSVHTRIVGGVDAKQFEFPWHVYMEVTVGPESYMCGGTLISEQFVLTAAHCLDQPGVKVKVIVGTENLDTSSGRGTEKRSVIQHIMHQQYDNRNVVNDIALMKLDRAVKLTESVLPACLPSSDIPDLTGIMATVTGFGAVAYNGELSDKLQAAQIEVWNKGKCNKAWGGNSAKESIVDSQICALGESNQDSCSGDSGGPLVTKLAGRWIAIGVTSYGFECASPGMPGVYTKVSEYLDWIQETMEGMSDK